MVISMEVIDIAYFLYNLFYLVMGIIIARNNNILFISSKYELPNFTTNTIKLNDIL